MNKLSAKDDPWRIGFEALGNSVLVVALMDRGFAHTFVVSWGQHESVFHVAWAMGMVLGVVAACFDELLGVRDFLLQRPIAARDVVKARLSGCAVVLAVWFVGAPFFAQVAYAIWDQDFQFGHWQQLPSIWAAMTPAVSACAIGLAAGSLPFAWWGRLWCLAALFLVCFPAIHWLALDWTSRMSSMPWFVGGHLVLAAAAVLLLVATGGARRDADRPLPARARCRLLAPLLVVMGVFLVVNLGIAATNVLERLHSIYPDPVEHDGRIVLSVRDDEGIRYVVDEHHVATGERLAPIARRSVDSGSMRTWSDFLRIEPPRRPAADSSRGSGGWLLVDADGSVWWDPVGHPLRRLTKPGTGAAFAPGSRPFRVESWSSMDLVLVEHDGAELWLLDSASGTLRPLRLPDGDRVRNVGAIREGTEIVDGPGDVPVGRGEWLVHGERGLYALRDGQLVPAGKVVPLVPRDGREPRTVKWEGRVDDADPMTWTLEFEGADGVATFRHTFTPRTFRERTLAGVALLGSLGRPPLLQLASSLHPAAVPHPDSGFQPATRWWWLFDPLVASGRRWWLVLASIALSVVLARAVRKRLRGLDADAATMRFWTIATLLLGLVGALASAVCETRRAWARRGVAIPTVLPRIVTPEPSSENVA